MEKQKSIKTNIAYNSAYNILTIIIPLILSPYLSRVLGAEGLGIYSFTLAIANYFKRASLLGMEKYGNRSIALVKDQENERRKAFWAIFKVQSICSIICLIVYVLYLIFLDTRGMPSLLQTLFVISSLFDVSWYYFGNEDFKPVVLVSSICKVAYLLFTFILVKGTGDVNIYIALAALSYLIPNVVIFIGALAKEKYTSNTADELRIILKGTFVLFIPVIAVTVYKSMDKVMLGIICETTYENGLYENAEKILHVPIAVISAVSTVLMPRMTRLYRDKDEKTANSFIMLTMKYAAIMSISAACGLAGISYVFSVVFWGVEFTGCAILLCMFSISIPFMSFAEIIRTQFIIPNKQDKTYIIAVCIGAIVNLIVNALLIPSMGAKGAVVGTILAEGSVCIYQAIKVSSYLPVKKYSIEFVKYIPAGLVMYVTTNYIGTKLSFSVFNLLLLVLIGAIEICVLVALQIFCFDKNTWKGLVEFFDRLKRNR